MSSLSEWIDEKVNDNVINYFNYGEFSNIEKIGVGGFGVVNRANWNNRGIKVALKIVLLNDSSISQDDVNEFIREVIK